MSGFSSDCLPDKVGLNCPIIIALRATSRHHDRMYNRALASAHTVVGAEMTQRRYRQLLLAHIASVVAAAVIGVAFPGMLPGDLSAAYETAMAATPIERFAWSWVIVLPILAVVVAGYVGLYQLRRWGRTLALVTTLVGFLVYPLAGPSVAAWLESALLDVSNITWGALLALAYFGPLASQFSANNSSKPTPLRGAA